MGLLTNKPSSIAKGSSQELSLSSGAQTTIAGMVNDSYLSDTSNWQRVVFYYTAGLQKVPVIFNLSTNKGKFKISDKARTGAWELLKIEINDFDGGQFIIMRGSLAAASDDDLSVVSA
jgi:hypothetical protein